MNWFSMARKVALSVWLLIGIIFRKKKEIKIFSIADETSKPACSWTLPVTQFLRLTNCIFIRLLNKLRKIKLVDKPKFSVNKHSLQCIEIINSQFCLVSKVIGIGSTVSFFVN
jgi:hypothetical protein